MLGAVGYCCCQSDHWDNLYLPLWHQKADIFNDTPGAVFVMNKGDILDEALGGFTVFGEEIAVFHNILGEFSVVLVATKPGILRY